MSDPSGLHSPLRFIKELAVKDDFVAFKLDIDNAAVEIPLAMNILHDPSLSNLIDEFFFELHFWCEIMETHGWGNMGTFRLDYGDGFYLDRYHSMLVFKRLREAGIRAHVWP